MKKSIFIPVFVAILAAVWASRKPDGLHKVAETLGFAHKGVQKPAAMAGYDLPWMGDSRVSAILAGVIGVLIVYFIFLLCLKFQSLRKETKL